MFIKAVLYFIYIKYKIYKIYKMEHLQVYDPHGRGATRRPAAQPD